MIDPITVLLLNSQVRYKARKCRESQKGFNVECDDQDPGACPFCCVDGCTRVKCDYGLVEAKRAEWERQLKELRRPLTFIFVRLITAAGCFFDVVLTF